MSALEEAEEAGDWLLAEGWAGFKDPTDRDLDVCTLRRNFYKFFPTDRKCQTNNDSRGIQVIIKLVSYFVDGSSHWTYEIRLSGELPDGTWIELHNWSMPDDIKEGVKKITRLIDLWEKASEYQVE